MRDDIKEALGKVKESCYELAKIAPYDRFRIEYNFNSRINDRGKLDLICIQHFYSS